MARVQSLAFLAAILWIASPCGAEDLKYRGKTPAGWAEILRTGNKEQQVEAQWALHGLGHEAAGAVSILMEIIKSGEHDRASGAALLFEDIGSAGAPAVPSLTALLDDEKSENIRRWYAAEALRGIGPAAKGAVPSLVKIVSSGPKTFAYFRSLAAQALGCIGRNEFGADAALTGALADKDDAVRLECVVALGRLGGDTPVVLKGLEARLADSSPRIRVKASLALLRATGAAGAGSSILADALKGAEGQLRFDVIEGLMEVGPAAAFAVPPLLTLLRSKDVEGRTDAAGALYRMGGGGAESVTALTDALGDRNKMVRGFCAAALGRIGAQAKPALPRLLDVLINAQGMERVMVAMGMNGITGAGEYVEVFIEGLKDGESAGWALQALYDMGPAAAPALSALSGLANSDNTYREFRNRAREIVVRIKKK